MTTTQQEAAEDNLLDFEVAMRDFSTMFPTASSVLIEDVLRRHDGDVATTIDELLWRTTNRGSGNSQRLPPPSTPPPPLPPMMRRRSADAGSPPPEYSPPPPAYSPPLTPMTMTPPTSVPTATTSSSSHPAPIARNIRYSRNSRLSFEDLEREKNKIRRLKRENERRLDTVTNEKEARELEDQQMALVIQSRELAKAMKEQATRDVPTRYRNPPLKKRSQSLSRKSSSEIQRVPQGPVVDGMLTNMENEILDKIRAISLASKTRLSQIATKIRGNRVSC